MYDQVEVLVYIEKDRTKCKGQNWVVRTRLDYSVVVRCLIRRYKRT